MEALLATAVDLNVVPHTEKLSLDIIESKCVENPELQVDLDNFKTVLVWPTGKIPSDFEFQSTAVKSLMEITGKLLSVACYSPDMRLLLKRLYEDELVTDRLVMMVAASNSYSRALGRRVSRLRNVGEIFSLRDRPLPDTKPRRPKGRALASDKSRANHRSIAVRSIIDVHLWDRARWRGAAYFDYGHKAPPALALMFENRDAAEKIFERWRARIGVVDDKEIIHLAIIRRTSEANPAEYKILVTSSAPIGRPTATGPIALVGRDVTMTPANSEHLDRFIAKQTNFASYLLMPAIYSDKGAEPLKQLYILKRRLIVRNAIDIGANDIEAIAVGSGAERISGNSGS
jgi:hypothetical protein